MRFCFGFQLCGILLLSGLLSGSYGKELDAYLSEAAFDKGITEILGDRHPRALSNEERFSVAILQFLSGLETLGRDFYRLGLDSQVGQEVGIPLLRLPIPLNPKPEQATPAEIYDAFEKFQSQMKAVQETLGDLDGEAFVLPVAFEEIRLDINGDGQLGDYEYLHQIYVTYNRRAEELFQDDGDPLIIAFDLGDAYWLKGYSHLLHALTDCLMAYDWKGAYEVSSHLFFQDVDSEIGQYLNENQAERFGDWADLIAAVHSINLPLARPKRMKSAHDQLFQVIECSRRSWERIEEETDDQDEWIPNPNQTGITGFRISAEMVETWKLFLDEFELILEGERLIPHWRFRKGIGVNLKTVFTKPKPFDLVLWVQGSAAIPYLEEGEVTSEETWRTINGTFRGNFIGFAIWIN